MENIQKRTDAMELEVPVEFKMNVHVPSQDDTQASLVPELSATSEEAMDCVSLESPVISLCDVSEHSTSLLGEDDHQEDNGKWFIWLLNYCLTFTTYILLSVWETLDYMDELLQQLQTAEDGSSMDYSPFLSKEHMLLYLLVHGTKPMVIPKRYSLLVLLVINCACLWNICMILIYACRVRALWSFCGLPWRLWSLQFLLCLQSSISNYLLICSHRRYNIWCFVTCSNQFYPCTDLCMYAHTIRT